MKILVKPASNDPLRDAARMTRVWRKQFTLSDVARCGAANRRFDADFRSRVLQ